ncbi:MAG: hypothetical protein M3445_08630 [Actinomycetota bacterium]|nr:hypothetical protein [Actinomycetota bacterium]
MALTLAQSAAVSRDMVAAGVMSTMAPESFILDRIRFETIEGTAYRYYSDATLPGAEFRAVNAAYAESTGTFTSSTEGLTILGGDADVDTFLQATRSDLIDQRAAQLELKSQAVAHKWNDSFINGNVAVDANSFNGLKQRLSGAQVISSGANGAAINTDSASRQTFFDQLDALIGAVPNADTLLTNANILSKFRSAARRETMATTSVDNLGRLVDTYNGLRLVNVGNKADGTPIIPQTETQGTALNAGSIYAVSFGTAAPAPGVVGLTNGGVRVQDLGQLETKPVYRTRIEWFVGLALFGPRPAARLTGVLAS